MVDIGLIIQIGVPTLLDRDSSRVFVLTIM
jgi:hypothetical protein